ncbi:MAG: response regulator, partial [Verrucomicrobiota bacterium]
LSAHREGGRIVLSVRDNGMGIPEEKLSELFELFAQGERGLARSEGGLGIGLAIVKRLTAMHGGTVFARSGGFGEGSEFIVHLPAIEPAAIRVTRPAAPPPAETPRPAKILIVDDNQDTADGLARLLRRRGYMVAVAYDGPTGLDAALNSSPEYVLLDIGLPGLDGYEVAARLREEQHAGSAMTLIAISGYGQEGDRQRSRAAGFDFHLTKPLNFTELEALLLPERREALSSWQH